VTTLLVSGGFTFFTSRLKERLDLDYAYANQLEILDGKLSGRVLGDILDGDAKANYLETLMEQLGATPEQCIAIGDGSNDLPMMSKVDYSVAYMAKPKVQEEARFSINHNGLDAVLSFFDN
ncbi:MAG TPA: HAD-IB family phosphatase, partial [Oligella sp.]|nr:HAD-IB family phosphatase [Oligella sp.]